MTGMSSKTGKRLTERDHIRQSIADILTTPIGTRVMRREYGSLLPELVDHPLNSANLLRARAATADALIRWEKRISIQSVQLYLDGAGLVVDLEATETNGTSSSLSVPLGLRGVMA